MNGHGSRPFDDLVQWRGELAELIQASLPGGATATVTFTRHHAAAATEKVTTGLVDPSELVKWAQAVHFADGLDIEDGHEDALTQFLVEISTPEIFEPVTVEVCQRWLRIMQTSPTSNESSTATP